MLASRGGESMRAVVFMRAEVKEEGRARSHASSWGQGTLLALETRQRFLVGIGGHRDNLE